MDMNSIYRNKAHAKKGVIDFRGMPTNAAPFVLYHYLRSLVGTHEALSAGNVIEGRDKIPVWESRLMEQIPDRGLVPLALCIHPSLLTTM
jgi:hypothetical protein